jgi:hypothetical protein
MNVKKLFNGLVELMSHSNVAEPEANAVSELKMSNLDPWKNDVNHNILMAGGASYMGCTYVSNSFLVKHVQEGGVAWAIRCNWAPDVDEKLNAKEDILDHDFPISINPLSFIETDNDFNAVAHTIVGWLISLLPEQYILQCKDGDDAQIFGQALQVSWNAKREHCGLSDILSTLDEMSEYSKDLALKIRTNIERLELTWFNGTCTIDTSKQYVSICPAKFGQSNDICLLARTILAIYGVCLITRIPRNTKTLLIIDEIDDLGNCGVEHILGDLLRRSCDLNSSILLTTRGFNPAKKMQTQTERVALENCNNQLVIDYYPEKFYHLVQYFTENDSVKCPSFGPSALWIQNGSAVLYSRKNFLNDYEYVTKSYPRLKSNQFNE